MRPVDRSRALQRRSRYETFEERLALTAQPLAQPSVGVDQELQQHYGELAPAELVSPVADLQLQVGADGQISHHASAGSSNFNDVHNLTGVNYVFDNFGLTGSGQTVAIIDSGIAWDHVALGGGFGSDYRVVGGYDFAENDADPYDDGPSGFHGTHVAGILGSSDSEHRGVATGVDLVGLRVFDDQGEGYFSWVEDALQWVHEHQDDFENPITTVNLSLGASWNANDVPNWSTLEDEFAQLKADGIFIAVSAGNSFNEFDAAGLSYPAASPNVVPVASVDSDGTISDFSQRSDRVLAAPGSYITSTIPDHVFGADGNPNDFGTSSGTSMASPYVAGASVLVRQAMDFIGVQNITQDTIYDHLRDTADVVYDAATRANYHLINLEAAITALMPSDDFGSSNDAAHWLGALADGNSFTGAIENVTDVDYFSFTAGGSGVATFTFDTTHELTVSAIVGGQSGELTNSTLTIDVVAGNTYTLAIGTNDGIGRYDVNIALASAHSDNSQSDTGNAGGESEAVVDPIVKAAYELDQAAGLKFAGKDYLNWGGTNEKWLQGNDGWYFIRPTGEVYKWSGSGKANGELVATLDASYYTNLSKLYDATPPEATQDKSTGSGKNTGGGSSKTDNEAVDDANGGGNNSTSGAESTIVTRARELDSQYGFTTDGKYYENWAGLGEKWLRSEELGWVFITPDGSVYDWNGNQATTINSPKVAQLDASFHQNPTLLTDPPAAGNAGSGEQGDVNEGAVSSGGNSSSDTEQGKNESSRDTLSKRASELDQQLGLRTTGDYYHNWAGLGEKWMTSADGKWYFITVDGSLYQWNGSQANASASARVAQLDSSFHADPSKLHDAPTTTSTQAFSAASIHRLRVEDAVTVIDTANVVNQHTLYSATLTRQAARDRVHSVASRSQKTNEGDKVATTRMEFFTAYETRGSSYEYDVIGVAKSSSTEDELTVLERVYQELEAERSSTQPNPDAIELARIRTNG